MGGKGVDPLVARDPWAKPQQTSQSRGVAAVPPADCAPPKAAGARAAASAPQAAAGSRPTSSSSSSAQSRASFYTSGYRMASWWRYGNRRWNGGGGGGGSYSTADWFRECSGDRGCGRVNIGAHWSCAGCFAEECNRRWMKAPAKATVLSSALGNLDGIARPGELCAEALTMLAFSDKSGLDMDVPVSAQINALANYLTETRGTLKVTGDAALQHVIDAGQRRLTALQTHRDSGHNPEQRLFHVNKEVETLARLIGAGEQRIANKGKALEELKGDIRAEVDANVERAAKKARLDVELAKLKTEQEAKSGVATAAGVAASSPGQAQGVPGVVSSIKALLSPGESAKIGHLLDLLQSQPRGAALPSQPTAVTVPSTVKASPDGGGDGMSDDDPLYDEDDGLLGEDLAALEGQANTDAPAISTDLLLRVTERGRKLKKAMAAPAKKKGKPVEKARQGARRPLRPRCQPVPNPLWWGRAPPYRAFVPGSARHFTPGAGLSFARIEDSNVDAWRWSGVGESLPVLFGRFNGDGWYPCGDWHCGDLDLLWWRLAGFGATFVSCGFRSRPMV